MSQSNQQTIPRLFGDAIDQLGKLIHNELALAQAEISEKIGQARMGAALVAAAGILIIPVLVVLLLTLALWLSQMGLSLVVAHLVAAAVGAVLSLVVGIIGMSYFNAKTLRPKVTIQQLGRDLDTAKELAK